MKKNRHKGRSFRGKGTRLIMGNHCVEEVMRKEPGRLMVVYTAKESCKLVSELEQHGIPVQRVTFDKLSELVHSESHQSIVAEVKERDQLDFRVYIDTLFEKDHDLILMLDSITDPHNVGAMLRAAECFGASCVIWSKNRGADITPAVSKVSVGASELVDIIRVSNLCECVKQLQEAGYSVITAEIDKEAVSIFEYSFPNKCVVVMGSEGKGIQPLLSKLGDQKVYIPMFGEIDSLNVSQATALFLAEARRG